MLRITVLVVVFGCRMFGWQSAGATPPAQEEAGMVLRFDVNLVQIDAVVTDRSGRHVSDLKAADFEVVQDGRRQEITHFSLMRGNVQTANEPVTATRGEARVAPAAFGQAGDIRRTVVFVIDDYGMAFSSFVATQTALRRYAEEVMAAGDQAAIKRVWGRSGLLDQVTGDRRQFRAALERMWWEPPSLRRADYSLPEVVSAVVKSLSAVPGRKSIVIFSDAVHPLNEQGKQMMLRIADEANRASVVINEIKPAGLQTYAPTAENAKATRQPGTDAPSEWALRTLARATGGDSYRDNSTFDAIRSDVIDLDEYYVLGWYPSAGTFDDRKNYHTVQVKVLRGGLDVRTRSGFFGQTGNLPQAKAGRVSDQMKSALFSEALRTSGIPMDVSAAFHPRRSGSYVEAFLHIGMADMKLTPEGKAGCEGANLELLYTLQPLDLASKARRVTTGQAVHVGGCDAKLAYLRVRGFVAVVHIPTDGPGPYRLRFAARVAELPGPLTSIDTTKLSAPESDDVRNLLQLGAVSTFIEVPDVRKPGLGPIGVVIGDPPEEFGAAGILWRTARQRDPAMRVFHPGEAVPWVFEVANKDVRGLDLRIAVEKAGKRLAEFPVSGGQTDEAYSRIKGEYRLGSSMTPGFYRFGVIKGGAAGKIDRETAEQWIDFEIVE